MPNMLKKIINKIKTVWPNVVYLKHGKTVHRLYRILYPYYLLRSTYPFWFHIANRKGKKRYAKKPQPLNALQQRIANDLKNNGIAFTHIDELFPGQNLLPELQQYAEGLLATREERTKGKLYMADLWDKSILDFNNPFLTKFILTPRIIAIANAYMNMSTKFFTFMLHLVKPVGDADPVSSQRWHRDPEDKKLCKVFLYLKDVDEETGPFTYVPQSQHGGRWNRAFPQKPLHGIIVPGDVVDKKVGKENIKIATGKAGTMVFCDTAGLHKGGHATKKHRLAFVGGFCSGGSLWATKFRYPDDYESHISNFTQPVKYALEPWWNYKKQHGK